MRDFAISVVVPVLNGEKTISRCMHSVINDSLHEKELLVVDNGSTDGTRSTVLNVIKNNPATEIRFIERDWKNANAARNLGLREARGKYVQFLDCDDVISNNKLEKTLDEFIDNQDLRCVYTDGAIVQGDLQPVREIVANHQHVCDIADRDFSFFTCGLNTAAPIWSRNYLIDENLFWDESLTCWQEAEFHFRALLQIGGSSKIKKKVLNGFSRFLSAEGISSNYFSEAYIQSQNKAIEKIFRFCLENDVSTKKVRWQRVNYKRSLLQRAIVSNAKESWKSLAPEVRLDPSIHLSYFLSWLPFKMVSNPYKFYKSLRRG